MMVASPENQDPSITNVGGDDNSKNNTSIPTHVASSTATSADNLSTSSSSSRQQLGVLGIGLIMEEVGKGARLVFRYPASPPPYFFLQQSSTSSSSSHQSVHQAESRNKNGTDYYNMIQRRGMMKSSTTNTNTTNNNASGSQNKNKIGNPSSSDGNSSSSGSIDLFFDLPARVLSKLFRPKRPLCGQPLTLNVSGTTFCCRAELFDSQPSTIGGGEGSSSSNHPLVLFSVIVALAPLAKSTTSVTNKETQQHDHNTVRHDAAFNTITTIHRNLARLCRVLTREELRCRYVSRQCNMLLEIRKEYESKVSADYHASLLDGSDGSGKGGAANNKSNTSTQAGDSKNVDNALPGPPLSPKDPKRTSTTTTITKEKTRTKSVGDDDEANLPEMTRTQRREYVQTLIEILIAQSPPPVVNDDTDDDLDGDIELQGNLARELANVFHWISSPSTVNASLSRAHENVVYVNRHVAVPLDPVIMPQSALSSESTIQTQYSIQPSHTLLFPNVSATEVLDGLMEGQQTFGVNEITASPSITQSLCRILPYIQPRKSLNEISYDAGLPLPHALEAASWLIKFGICVTAMPVLRKNKYVCADGVVQRMAELALPFWQNFGVRSQDCKFHWGGKNGEETTTGAPHIFVVVSALTSKASSSASPTLGEAIESLCGAGDTNNNAVSPHIKRRNSYHYGENRSSGMSSSMHKSNPSLGVMDSATVVEEMAVWLIANRVIIYFAKYI